MCRNSNSDTLHEEDYQDCETRQSEEGLQGMLGKCVCVCVCERDENR